MDNRRPIDVLDHAKNKRVLVVLKNRQTVSGILVALDMHLNMWLNEAEVTSKDEAGQETTTKYGKLLVRGDSVILASPAE